MGVKKGKDRPTRYASAGWAKGKPLLVEQGASQGRGVGAFWIYLDLVYLDLVYLDLVYLDLVYLDLVYY